MFRLLRFLRNVFAAIGVICVLGGGFVAYKIAASYNLPPQVFAQKVLKKVNMEDSYLAELVKPGPIRPPELELPALTQKEWHGHGARADRVLSSVVYNEQGWPVPNEWQAGGKLVSEPVGPFREVEVSSSKGFVHALKKAQPGDVIKLKPGVYRINSRNVEIMRGGSREQPIRVDGQHLGDVVIELNSQEGFWINAPYWCFENLVIKGVKKDHDYGEHAFHIVGKGRGFVLRNCRVHEFNAMIKANGIRWRDGEFYYPDGALIENNHFFNSEVRRTSHPVTFIDVLAADHWVVRGNLIADFRKGQGDQISYGAFLKGNSHDGVFENNLVIGAYRTSGGVRVGLSLGGGGTGKRYFRDQKTSVEHSNGIVRNNVVMYCSDVAVYLNKANKTKVLNNTFYQTSGVDVRFPESSALVANNILTGKVRERDGGVLLHEDNERFDKKDFYKWFVDPARANFTLRESVKWGAKGQAYPEVFEDLCGNRRGDTPDVGAFEVSRLNGECGQLLGI